jgi:hypothetical protein
LQLSSRKCSVAIIDSKTLGSAARLTHLRLNLLTRTVYTIEVDNVSVAANHAVQRNVVKAAYTFAHLIVHFRVFQIGFFSQLSVFDLLAFGC